MERLFSRPNKKADYGIVSNNICEMLRTYLENNKLKSLILGVSGGIDSAVCAVLASKVCKELKIPLIGRSLPLRTNKNEEKKRAYDIGSNFCDDFRTVELSILLSSIQHDMMRGKEDNPIWKIRLGNIKARLRMMYLYDVARKNDGAVISTDNLTENLLGYWTLHGDVGDIGIIQQLWKTEVFCLGRYLAQYYLSKIETEKAEAIIQCVQATPTAGLGVSDSDLAEILPDWTGNHQEGYETVDMILHAYLSGNKEAEKHSVVQRHLATKFKRENPYNFFRTCIMPNIVEELK